MKDCYTTYIRRIGRELDLPRRQKKELLLGFQRELEERFAEPPSEEILLNEVGQPEEVACTLLMGVDLNERKRYRVRRLFQLRLAVVILSLLLALSVGAFLYSDATRISRAVVTITEDPVYIQYSTDMNGG